MLLYRPQSPQVLPQPLRDSNIPRDPPSPPQKPHSLPPRGTNAPSRPPKVKVILGEDREATGILLSIDGEDGIVRMDLEEQLKILNLRFLGKLLEA